MLRILYSLLLMTAFTQAYADCTYGKGVTYFSNNSQGINDFRMYLNGTFSGISQGKWGSVLYNGNIYTVGVKRGEGNQGKNVIVDFYEVCSTPSVAYSYTTTQDQAGACPADRPSGYILQRRTYEVWTDGSARNFGGWYNVADYCSAVGLYTTTRDNAVGCPAERPSGYILQRQSYEVWSDGSTRNFSAWYNVADYCVAVYSSTQTFYQQYTCAPVDGQGRITSSGTFVNAYQYQLWSDNTWRNQTAWYNVNDYCAVRGSETQTVSCPSTMPDGVITQSRTFEFYTTTVYSYGGQRFNYTAWNTIGSTCKAVFQSNETQTQLAACPAPYAEGGNGQTQTRTRQIWSDGPRAWSAWSNIGTGTTCYKTVADTRVDPRATCGEGQTGYRVMEGRRTHKEYSVNSGKTPAEIAALNEQNATTWTSVEISNTCVNVPDRVTKEQGTRLLTCASIYGGTANDYTGEIIETGTKVYTYSNLTKQTTTSFVSNNPVTYNDTCKTSMSDMTTESSTKACPSGYTGTVTSYRYVATDSKGVKSYPRGTDFIESSNNCVSNNSSVDDSANISNTVKSKGLLANNTIKTSSLNTKTDLDTFVKTLDKSTVSKDQNYKLHLIVDDLSTGNYNKGNVTKTVNAFKSVTGQDPIITIPQSLDKYIGNGGITASNYKTKVLKSAKIDSQNQVVVTYAELTKGLKEGKESTFTVKILD
jgi:hypothetical protein